MARFQDLPDALTAACIHCGLCLETCPTYVETGLETESPRGRIHLMEALARGRWEPAADNLEPLDHCLGCLACETACPSGVQYGALLETARQAGATVSPRSRWESWLARHVLWRGRTLERAALWYRRLGGNRWRRWLGVGRRRRLRILWPEVETPGVPVSGASGEPAVLVRGCVARAAFSATERSMHRLLAAAGYGVTVLEEPDCCGALAAHAGLGDPARRRAAETLAALEGTRGPIVLTASGCAQHVSRLSHWVKPEQVDAARDVEKRVCDLSVALENAPKMLQFVPGREPATAVYQDACHLQHGLGVRKEPRRWLERAGVRLIEAAEAELCCGSAGSYNIANPSLGEALGRRKAARLAETGARFVVTANPGCAIQLRAHAPAGMRVVTWATLLEQRLKT